MKEQLISDEREAYPWTEGTWRPKKKEQLISDERGLPLD